MPDNDSPARTLGHLPQHPLRYKLNNEVHARPPVSLTHPQRVSYLALIHDGTTEDSELQQLRALADAFARPLPEADGGHLQLDVGDFLLKWERHNDFSSYAFFCTPRDDETDARHGALPRRSAGAGSHCARPLVGLPPEPRYPLTRLTSPVDGTVQQLAVHTTGGVVTPAQVLMVVVPDEAQVTAEVTLENKDVGFVNVGQAAEIKLETFTFTRYGTVNATVEKVTQDAVNDEKRTPTKGSA